VTLTIDYNIGVSLGCYRISDEDDVDFSVILFDAISVDGGRVLL